MSDDKKRRSSPSFSKTVVAHLSEASKIYTVSKKEIVIFENLNIEFLASEVYAIIGASGSGKSTLLNIIGGLDTPSSGTVTLCGKDISHSSESSLAELRASKVGFIFQQHCLINELSVLENVLLPSDIYSYTRDGAAERADTLLRKVGLKNRQDHLVGELSGGEMQRAAIARALVNTPEVVLADEPTGDLDSDNANEAFSLLHSLAKSSKTAIIMVTHDLSLAQRADTVLRIHNRKLNKVKIEQR